MRNINFSGLKGQALSVEMCDIPSMKEFQSVIPDHCFNCDTRTSIGYLLQTILIQAFVIAIGLTIPCTKSMIPIWFIYAFISGTTAMGFWVIAHECGHGALGCWKLLLVTYSIHFY